MGHESRGTAAAELETLPIGELIEAYLTEGEPDSELARELSTRVLTHAGYDRQMAWQPLHDKYGKQEVLHGKLLHLRDYIEYLEDDHPYALDGVIDFLESSVGSPEYVAGRSVATRFVTVRS